jgi:hypothetical protein
VSLSAHSHVPDDTPKTAERALSFVSHPFLDQRPIFPQHEWLFFRLPLMSFVVAIWAKQLQVSDSITLSNMMKAQSFHLGTLFAASAFAPLLLMKELSFGF